jgi:N-methylhydantoinase B
MRPDPVKLEIYKHLLHSVAEEMGVALRRTALSPNIKERRDYSCAVFDGNGEVVAMGDHMPVHLGSMPMSVSAVIRAVPLAPNDIAMVNDPFAGGTHLPDITLVMPVFHHSRTARPKPAFYVAARAHHADVGGAFAGSMGTAREIYQEGVRIPPVKLIAGGGWIEPVRQLLLANVRTPEERDGDLAAQVAACRTGARRLQEIAARYRQPEVDEYMRHLNAYGARMMQQTLTTIPAGRYEAEDFLDDGGATGEPIRIAVAIEIIRQRGRRGGTQARVDFSGSALQQPGSINGVYAIAYSASYYVFRCLLSEDVPACAGLLRDIEVIAPPGTVVNAQPPAAVAGGNVELSQRIVDVLFRALSTALPAVIPAASSGTMNNLTIGCVDPRNGRPCAYYETIGGGMGARPNANGVSGVHTHMTNSLNTPIEVLEMFYPFRIRKYALRGGSGGAGRFWGGDGIIRELEVLNEADVTILSDRRKRGPYGLAGGADGKPGQNTLVTSNGERMLPGKVSLRLKSGDAIRIETPGGGGWGPP